MKTRKLNVMFLGTLFDFDEEENILSYSKIGIQNQINKFQYAVIKGLKENNLHRIDVINVEPVGTYPKHYNKLFLKSKNWLLDSNIKSKQLGSINIPILKQLSRRLKAEREIKKWLKSNNNGDSKHIIIYGLYLPYLKAIKRVSDDIKITAIVTDLPEFDELSYNQNILKRTIRSHHNKQIYKHLQRIDNYVLLTEQMKYPLNISKKPYVIIEGIIDVDNNINTITDNFEKSDKKIILYTGTLMKIYGLINLLESLQYLDQAYELWICGKGEAEEDISNYQKTDSRIKYFGYVTADKAAELQSKATLLVNPRDDIGEYTKYSFPSKTMEYLASGKPVLMNKLSGIPEEYYNYVNVLDGNSPFEIANSIKRICELTPIELENIGIKGKNFVIENKNSKYQARKIIEMWLKNDYKRE